MGPGGMGVAWGYCDSSCPVEGQWKVVMDVRMMMEVRMMAMTMMRMMIDDGGNDDVSDVVFEVIGNSETKEMAIS